MKLDVERVGARVEERRLEDARRDASEARAAALLANHSGLKDSAGAKVPLVAVPKFLLLFANASSSKPTDEQAVSLSERYLKGKQVEKLSARGYGPDEAVLHFVGVVTNRCVASTLLHGIEMGYEAVLLEGGCCAADAEQHASGLQSIRDKGGDAVEVRT